MKAHSHGVEHSMAVVKPRHTTLNISAETAHRCVVAHSTAMIRMKAHNTECAQACWGAPHCKDQDEGKHHWKVQLQAHRRAGGQISARVK